MTRPRNQKSPKFKGIKIKAPNGSDYVLSMIDIAMHKAKATAGPTRNPRTIMATAIMPEFQKNPEKAREWAKKMSVSDMIFLKVRQAPEPTSEELAKHLEKGEIE